MPSKKSKLSILSKSDMQMIHGATMEVLSQVGVLVDCERTLDILQQHGYDVDRGSKTVKMPEERVMEAVKSCKRNFKWHARSDKHTFEVVDGRTKFGPGAQCLYYIDPETEEFRRATLQDGIVACRLLDALENAPVAYVPVHTSDVPDEVSSVVGWAAGIVNTSKPSYGNGGYDQEFDLMLRVADVLLGNRDRLRKKNLFPGYIDPISPLGHDTRMLGTLLRSCEWNQPVFVTVMALAGGTAPASLAGLLVQQNAEILSSIAIAKCATKAPKIVYGSVSCPLDMRSGIASTGSPEFSLIGAASVQLAKHYRLPSNMGVQSDSKVVDEQTAYEKAQAALTAVMVGADFSELFMGSTETFNAFSPVQLMIDDEIASNVCRMERGIEVNEDTLSVDVIAKTGPLGNYLKHPKTLKHFRSEHSLAKLSDRQSRQQWAASGSKRTKERAEERMKHLLRTHTPEPLEPEVRKDLEALVSEYTKEYTLGMLENVDAVAR